MTTRYECVGGGLFLNNRHYDPTTGVFISVDPLFAQTGEAYVYGGASPVVGSDPSGLEVCYVNTTICWGAGDPQPPRPGTGGGGSAPTPTPAEILDEVTLNYPDGWEPKSVGVSSLLPAGTTGQDTTHHLADPAAVARAAGCLTFQRCEDLSLTFVGFASDVEATSENLDLKVIGAIIKACGQIESTVCGRFQKIFSWSTTADGIVNPKEGEVGAVFDAFVIVNANRGSYNDVPYVMVVQLVSTQNSGQFAEGYNRDIADNTRTGYESKVIQPGHTFHMTGTAINWAHYLATNWHYGL